MQGQAGFHYVDGLTFDGKGGRLLGTLRLSDALIEVNPTTGQPLLLAPLDPAVDPEVAAMAYDGATELLADRDLIEGRRPAPADRVRLRGARGARRPTAARRRGQGRNHGAS